MSQDFVHLHVHTEYSMLDGAARLGDLFDTVAKVGQRAIAMTDHGNLYGAFEFYNSAKSAGIKPIIGIEGYFAPQGRTERRAFDFGGGYDEGAGDVAEGKGKFAYTHMTLWAQSTEGLHNLYRLSSLASIEGYYRHPRFDRELMQQYGAGLIGTTGCPSGEVNRWLQAGNYERALATAADMQEILGRENYFCELMDHGIAIERRFRDDLLQIAKTLNLPLVATNDLHYVRPEDAKVHDAFLCVGTKSTLDDPKRFRFDAQDFYVKSAAEMEQVWGHLPEAISNTLLIAERCDVTLGEPRKLMPRFEVPAGETEESWLIKEVERGLAARFAPHPVPEGHRKQAEYEVAMIVQMGFPGYFLVTADLIAHAKSVGIRVGPGRGSAAGALIAWAMGITELDPLKHGLLFERFLNPERVSMPDIDIDFDERRRAEMIKYATDKYGSDRVAQIVTYGTIKAKAAIKDSARVLGLPFNVSDRITKAMPPAVMGKDIPLAGIFDVGHKRYAEAAEFRELYDADEGVRQIVDLARGLEGLKRQVGVHAAGVILSSDPLIDVLPLWRRDDGTIITQWDMGACEKIGLLKMDFLGLRNLTVLDDCLRHIEANAGAKVVLEDLSLDDRATYELLARGDTLGVFQLDGGPMRQLLRSMVPDNFEDISAVLALYRPGPMGANAHNDYADRKNGRKPVIPMHPDLAEPLEEILGESYGLCVTGDTMVWDARTGARRRIDSIAEDVRLGRFSTFGIDARGVAVARPVSHWVSTGSKPVFKIRTQDGRVLRVSGDHPVLTPSGWRKADELRPGIDRLAVPRTQLTPTSGSSALNPGRGRILGCLLGEGGLTPHQNTFTAGSRELLHDMASRVSLEFPDTYPVLRYRSTGSRRGGRAAAVAGRLDFMAGPAGLGRGRGTEGGRYERLGLNRWLRELGFGGPTKSAEKFIPDEVFASSNDVVLEVLVGLWDTDGHVGPETAFFTATSEALARGVQVLLARLGVHGRLSCDTATPSAKPAYRVDVYQESFWDIVVPRLVSKHKRNVARRPTEQARTTWGIDGERMMQQMTPIVLASPATPRQGRAAAEAGGRIGMTMLAPHLERTHDGAFGSDRPLLGSDGAFLPLGGLAEVDPRQYGTDEDVCYANQSWTPIVAIDHDGEAEMYDITVDEIHNFIADDFVVHNCIYQEQVMAIAQKLAGYSLGKADLLRRAMGKKKKEIIDAEFVPFRDGMRANGYGDEAIGKLWEVLVPFSDYAFNKAHTAGYGLVSYWTAYLKANYPAEYMAALLTSVKDDKDKSAIYLNECRRMGIKVLPPDVNESESDFAPRGTDIRFGLSAIRNVGGNVVDSLMRTRADHGRFADFPDFIDAVEAVACNKRTVESLIKAGAFDSLGHTRKGLLQVHEQVIDVGMEAKRAAAIGQYDLFGGFGGDSVAEESLAVSIPIGEWDKATLLGAEREMLGLYVSDHPLNGLEHLLRANSDCRLADLLEGDRAGQIVTVAGLVTSVQRKMTKATGEPWAIVTVEDLDASIDVMVFPKSYAPVSARLVEDAVVVMRGKFDRREDEAPRITATEITFPDLTAEDSGPVRISLDVARCVPPVVDAMKEILHNHPGTVDVHLHLKRGTTTTVLRLEDRFRVRPGPSLYADLKALLGAGCLG